MSAHITAADAARKARVSYRQLDYWTTHGLIRVKEANPGTGNRRRYTEREVRVLTLMARLVKAGVEPRAASKIARQIVTRGAGRLGPLVVTERSAA